MLIITKCECGAITVEGNNFSNSMTEETFLREFPDEDVPGETNWGNCNHCVNHYGIDLCACGSGEPVGKCDGDYEECKEGLPFQDKGERTLSVIEKMISGLDFIIWQ